MNKTAAVTALLVVLIIALGLGAAYYSGLFHGTDERRTDGGPVETPTASPSKPATTDSTRVSTPSTPLPPFSFSIDEVENCGFTCRDVTVTLHNNQDDAATGVTVESRIYAGQDSTDSADLIWQGTQSVGTLEAGAIYTTTRRVELSLQEVEIITRNDGWVTIVTVVESDERTVTFQNNEQVI